MSTDIGPPLDAVLERSRQLGFLGPGPALDHIGHAERYQAAVEEFRRRGGLATVRGVDLGAGGGVPALPLLMADDGLELVLVDSSQRRMSFCAWAVAELGLGDRSEVWTGRAETFAHDPGRRGLFDMVIARGFGPPATTLECAAPLLRRGGWCVVSEPPEPRPWPTSIPELGLIAVSATPGVAVFASTGSVDKKFPRTSKVQKRSPLFML